MFIAGVKVRASRTEQAKQLLKNPFVIKTLLKGSSVELSDGDFYSPILARKVTYEGDISKSKVTSYVTARKNKLLRDLFPVITSVESIKTYPTSVRCAYCLEVLWAINELEKETEGREVKDYQYFMISDTTRESLKSIFKSCIVTITGYAKEARKNLDSGSYISGEYYHLLSRLNGQEITENNVIKALYRSRSRKGKAIYKEGEGLTTMKPEIHTSRLRKQIQEVLALKCGVDKSLIGYFIWQGGCNKRNKRNTKSTYSLKGKIAYYNDLTINRWTPGVSLHNSKREISHQELKDMWVFGYKQYKTPIILDGGKVYERPFVQDLKEGVFGIHRLITDNINCLGKFVGSSLSDGGIEYKVLGIEKSWSKVRVKQSVWADCWGLVFIYCTLASPMFGYDSEQPIRGGNCNKDNGIMNIFINHVTEELNKWTGVNKENVTKCALLFDLANELGIKTDFNYQLNFTK